MKRIAIIGAGFSGLAVCWHLLQQGRSEVVVFDRKIGGGASGMAAGLLHPYAGAHAKLNWMGLEGMEATRRLLDVAEKEMGQPVAQTAGILRIALDDNQLNDYQQCASKYQDVEWWDANKTQSVVPGLVKKPGIWIKNGLTVNCTLYLQGLWQACQKLGAKVEQTEVEDLGSLDDFDTIIVAAGARIKRFKLFESIPLNYVKGQLIEFSWPTQVPQLSLPVNSYVYMVKHPTRDTCFAGATYERHFTNDGPEPDKAFAEIAPQVQALFPHMQNIERLDCQAGIRVFNPHHRPSFGQINEKVWYLTGMGSKGLLYHALFAGMLAEKLGPVPA